MFKMVGFWTGYGSPPVSARRKISQGFVLIISAPAIPPQVEEAVLAKMGQEQLTNLERRISALMAELATGEDKQQVKYDDKYCDRTCQKLRIPSGGNPDGGMPACSCDKDAKNVGCFRLENDEQAEDMCH